MTSVPDFVLFKGRMHLDVDYMVHGGTGHTVCHIAWYLLKVLGRVPFPFACCVILSLCFENGNGTPPRSDKERLYARVTGDMHGGDRPSLREQREKLCPSTVVRCLLSRFSLCGSLLQCDLQKN